MKQSWSGVLLNTKTFSEIILTECRFFFLFPLVFLELRMNSGRSSFPLFVLRLHVIRAGNSDTQNPWDLISFFETTNQDEHVPCFLFFAKYRGGTGSCCPQLSLVTHEPCQPSWALSLQLLGLFPSLFQRRGLLQNFIASMLRNLLQISSLHMCWCVI